MDSVRRRAVGAAAALAVIGYAWVAAGLRPFTFPALVATLAGGAVAIAVGGELKPSVRSTREGTTGGAWLWAVLAGAAGLWQLQAYLQGPRSDHPTISSLTNDLLESHPLRAAAMALWLAAGVWLARR